MKIFSEKLPKQKLIETGEMIRTLHMLFQMHSDSDSCNAVATVSYTGGRTLFGIAHRPFTENLLAAKLLDFKTSPFSKTIFSGKTHCKKEKDLNKIIKINWSVLWKQNSISCISRAGWVVFDNG